MTTNLLNYMGKNVCDGVLVKCEIISMLNVP